MILLSPKPSCISPGTKGWKDGATHNYLLITIHKIFPSIPSSPGSATGVEITENRGMLSAFNGGETSTGPFHTPYVIMKAGKKRERENFSLV